MKGINRKLLMGILLATCVVCGFSLPAAAATNNTLSGTYFAGEMRAGLNQPMSRTMAIRMAAAGGMRGFCENSRRIK